MAKRYINFQKLSIFRIQPHSTISHHSYHYGVDPNIAATIVKFESASSEGARLGLTRLTDWLVGGFRGHDRARRTKMTDGATMLIGRRWGALHGSGKSERFGGGWIYIWLRIYDAGMSEQRGF
jgi:hypothetical protein